MAQLKVGIVEGWTAPMDFQLLNDGLAQDLSSMTVTAQARTRAREFIDLTGDCTVVTATEGKVRLTPDTGDFMEAQSPYELRFRVRDSSTQDAYFPSDEAVLVLVRP